MTQQPLASLVGRDKGQVAHLLHALQTRGHLERAPDDQDRRVLHMGVTIAGLAEVQRFKGIEEEFTGHLLSAPTHGETAQLQATVAWVLDRARRPA